MDEKNTEEKTPDDFTDLNKNMFTTYFKFIISICFVIT